MKADKVIVIIAVFFVVLILGHDFYMPVLLSLLRRFSVAMAETQTRSYTTGTHSMAFVTVPDMETAKKLSSHMVSSKLAACVNIIPQVTSVYEWEGKVEEDSELILMIKTATSNIDMISEYIRKNHPYNCAEVISSRIDNGNPAYLDWISKTVNLPVGEPSAKQPRNNDM